MKPHTRIAIAYIVGCLISGKHSTVVYDYASSKPCSFSINSSTSGISVYDYSKRCYISGGLTSIYHYGNRQYISIEIKGKNFNGYDYDGRCYFSGSVNSRSVSLYDYGVASYFNYSI
jgi:hypothetical protein